MSFLFTQDLVTDSKFSIYFYLDSYRGNLKQKSVRLHACSASTWPCIKFPLAKNKQLPEIPFAFTCPPMFFSVWILQTFDGKKTEVLRNSLPCFSEATICFCVLEKNNMFALPPQETLMLFNFHSSWKPRQILVCPFFLERIRGFKTYMFLSMESTCSCLSWGVRLNGTDLSIFWGLHQPSWWSWCLKNLRFTPHHSTVLQD